MKRHLFIALLVFTLGTAGAATAYAVGKITWLKPGQCESVGGVKACARAPKAVTVTKTVKKTVYPPAYGNVYSGPGWQIVPPFTVRHATTITCKTHLGDEFVVNNWNGQTILSNNGGSDTTCGNSPLPPGDYELQVMADGPWTIKVGS